MKQKVNKVYKDLFVKKPRYIILMGGRGAGRSTVASQFANAKLVAPEYFRCAIMRYILGDIRNSIYREILDRADENEILEKLTINESTMTISYGENTINAVGFRKSSGDQKSKLKSLANYNCVIIEEADEIPEEDFMQLDDSLRTVKGDITIILLLNPPPKTHWIIKRWFDLIDSEQVGFYIPRLKAERTDTVCIRSSYLDNIKNIAPASVAQYELYKETKPEHYYNMIRGLVPETVKGKIYKDWRIISHIPHEARLERYGLDFGFSNDPTTVVAVYRYNGGLIFDEVLYRKGLLNKPLADILQSQKFALVVADSEDPKSIVELNTYGLQVIGAKKGKDSIRFGIATVQQQRCSVTKRSVHILEEYDNYSWMEDKDGNGLNVPKPGYDHCLSGNTLVDTVNGQIKIRELVGKSGYLYSENGKIRKFYDVRQTGVEQIYEVEFTNGTKVFCSSEHPFKLENGDWCPASLLIQKDKIQLVTYERNCNISDKAKFQWKKLLLWKWEVFQKVGKSHSIGSTSSGLLDTTQWQYTKGVSYSPQGWRLEKQSNRELRNKTKTPTLERTHDSREKKKTKGLDREDKTAGLKVARLRTRISLPFKTWQDIMEKERREKNKLLTLWQRIQYAISDSIKILPPELQNESQTTQIKRITRKPYRLKVYNLEVEDTHSFSINGGVIVSNCMDAIRYAVKNIIPDDTIPKKQFSGQNILDQLMEEQY